MTRAKDIRWGPEEWQAFWDILEDWGDVRGAYGGRSQHLTKQSIKSILSRVELDVKASAEHQWLQDEVDDPGLLTTVATIRHLRKRL